jgi:hypothetical protein
MIGKGRLLAKPSNGRYSLRKAKVHMIDLDRSHFADVQSAL